MESVDRGCGVIAGVIGPPWEGAEVSDDRRITADESPKWTSCFPTPRASVYIRSKNAQKVSPSLTFQPGQRDLPVAKLDPQTVSCQADQT